MVEANRKRYPASNYSVGEDVLLRNPNAFTKRGKRILDKVASYKGKILEKKGKEFKVVFLNEDGRQSTEWINLKNLISVTREEEIERRKHKTKKEKTTKTTTKMVGYVSCIFVNIVKYCVFQNDKAYM